MSDRMRNSQSTVHNPRPSVVELHIGELVLEGFPAMDRVQLGAAVRQELSRLFAEQGAPAGLGRGGEIACLDGGEFRLAQGADAQMVGAQIAQAVYGRLNR